ncbi:MAG: AI-2E family transporter [Ruminococcus sp.]|nr:AI-2E family transporter [Candidatus Apopatosoma intestinale]
MKKVDWNKKYTTIAVYAFLVILLSILCIFFFLNYSDFGGYIKKFFAILSPVLLGILFAYLLNPVVRFFENKAFAFITKNGKKRRLARALSVTCTYVIVLLALTGFVALVVPQIVSGYADLSSNMSNYIKTIQGWLASLAGTNEYISQIVEKLTAYLSDLLGRLSELIAELLPSITKVLSGVITVIKEKKYESFMKNVTVADKSFGGFISAKILDSIIIGIICFFSMAMLGMPYYPLISLIVGVTNVIPFFGPFIGAIPGVFIIFITNPTKALWFIVLIFLIQQLDGNYIGPKLIGSSIGLEPVWIIVSITVMSGLLGFTGMVFGVPFFAVIYAFIKNSVESKLRAKGMPESTSEYYTTEAGKQLCRERAEADARHSRKFSETKLGSVIADAFAKLKRRKAEAKEDKTACNDDNAAETAASTEVSDDSEKNI